jgi:hypothetical protein
MENFEKFLKSKPSEIPKPFIKEEPKSLEKEILKKNEEEFVAEPERKEEKGYYDALREELRSMKEGGVDSHFSDIDVDNMSLETLELYRKHKKEKLSEEEIKKFDDKFERGSADYNFIAMIRNWTIDRIEKDRQKEKELLKDKAAKKFNDLRKNNPHIAARIDGIKWDDLGRADYKVLIDLNEQNLKSYEDQLKSYFSNKLRGEKEIIKALEKDPKYRYYGMLRDIMQKGPPNPDIFTHNL